MRLFSSRIRCSGRTPAPHGLGRGAGPTPPQAVIETNQYRFDVPAIGILSIHRHPGGPAEIGRLRRFPRPQYTDARANQWRRSRNTTSVRSYSSVYRLFRFERCSFFVETVVHCHLDDLRPSEHGVLSGVVAADTRIPADAVQIQIVGFAGLTALSPQKLQFVVQRPLGKLLLVVRGCRMSNCDVHSC
jgi:hypothetical protein